MNRKTALYHGGFDYIQKPNLYSSSISCDFGPGFYTTPYKEQAREWAFKKMRTTRRDYCVVSEYELDIPIDSNLYIKEFKKPDTEWVKLVLSGREGLSSPYDIIIGPIADSELNTIISECQEKLWLIEFKNPRQFKEDQEKILEETASRLSDNPKKDYKQCVFITEKGLRSLRFVDARRYDIEGKLTHTFKHGEIKAQPRSKGIGKNRAGQPKKHNHSERGGRS